MVKVPCNYFIGRPQTKIEPDYHCYQWKIEQKAKQGISIVYMTLKLQSYEFGAKSLKNNLIQKGTFEGHKPGLKPWTMLSMEKWAKVEIE